MATRVNTTTGSTDGPQAFLDAAAANHTAGNLIIAYVGWEDSANLSSVTDTAGNTYTLLTQRGTTEPLARIGYCANCIGHASNVVRANFSAATDFMRIIVVQYSGMSIASVADVDNGNASLTPATSMPAGDLVTTVADDVLGVCSKAYTAGSFTPFTNWTEITEVGGQFAAGERLVSSTSTYPSGQTFSANTSWASCSVALKAVPPAITLTGTLLDTIEKADIVAGGKTLIATLSGDTIAPASATNIQYVGGQGAGFAGTTSAQTITFALTGGLASTPAAGDLVIITYFVGSTVDRSLAIRNTSAVDYTLMGSELTQSDNFDANQRTAYRFMPGTPETQFVLTETVGGGTGNIADAGRYTVHVFRGVDATTPMDVAVVTAGASNSSAVNPGSITPTTSGAWIYAAGGAAAGTGSTMTSSNLLDFRAGSTADTNDASIGAGYAIWTSGAFDPAAYGTIPAGTTANSWTSITAALRPAVLTPFNDARAGYIQGYDSAQSEATGWNAEVRDKAAVTEIARTDNQTVTWTLGAQAGYDITAQEIVEGTIGPSMFATFRGTITATPTFTIDEGAGAIELAGAGAISLTTASALTTSIRLTGASTIALSTASVLTTAIRFTSTASVSVAASSALTTAVRLAGTSTVSVTGVGALTTAIRLVAPSSTIALTGSSSLTTAVRLAGASTIALTASGAMEAVGAALAGASTVTLTGASVLSTAIRPTGVSSIALTSSAALSTQIRLAGASALSVTASAALESGAAQLSGTSTVAVTTAGALTTQIDLTGASTCTITSASTLVTAIRLAGTSTLAFSAVANFAPVVEASPDYIMVVGSDDIVIQTGPDDMRVRVEADDVVVLI